MRLRIGVAVGLVAALGLAAATAGAFCPIEPWRSSRLGIHNLSGGADASTFTTHALASGWIGLTWDVSGANAGQIAAINIAEPLGIRTILVLRYRNQANIAETLSGATAGGAGISTTVTRTDVLAAMALIPRGVRRFVIENELTAAEFWVSPIPAYWGHFQAVRAAVREARPGVLVAPAAPSTGGLVAANDPADPDYAVAHEILARSAALPREFFAVHAWRCTADIPLMWASLAAHGIGAPIYATEAGYPDPGCPSIGHQGDGVWLNAEAELNLRTHFNTLWSQSPAPVAALYGKLVDDVVTTGRYAHVGLYQSDGLTPKGQARIFGEMARGGP